MTNLAMINSEKISICKHESITLKAVYGFFFFSISSKQIFFKGFEPHEEPRPLSVVFHVRAFFCPFVALPRNSVMNTLNCIHQRWIFFLYLL